MERIENMARILDVTNTFARDADDTRNWLSIPRINGDLTEFYKKHTEATQRSVGEFYLLDATNPTSVQSFIAAARENARTLRALISTEMWLQINVFYGKIRALNAADHHAGPFHRGLRHAEGRRAGAYRHHRGHALPRPGLALLHDRPVPGARGPDHPPAGHQVPLAGAAVRAVGRRYRRRPVERFAARRRRLPRLSPGTSQRLQRHTRSPASCSPTPPSPARSA